MNSKNISQQKNLYDENCFKGKKNDNTVYKKSTKISTDLAKMDFFYKNEKISQMESLNFEYKHFACPTILDQQYEILTKLICAFMNTQGGYAFVGIDNTGIVRGRKMQLEDRNDFKNRITQIVDGFIPKADKDFVNIGFLPVKGRKDSEESNDHYVIKITVKKGEIHEVYCTSQGKSYYRLDGQTRKFDPAEYQTEVLKRREHNPAFIKATTIITSEIPKVETTIPEMANTTIFCYNSFIPSYQAMPHFNVMGTFPCQYGQGYGWPGVGYNQGTFYPPQ